MIRICNIFQENRILDGVLLHKEVSKRQIKALGLQV